MVSSVLKNVDVSLLRAYDLWISGELPFGEVEKVGLAEGAVGLAEDGVMARLADKATRDAITEAARAIEAGEVVVPTAFGMDQGALDLLRAQVRP